MAQNFRSRIMTGTGTDLAFAMVVLVTYFFIFSNFGVLNGVQIFSLIILGVIYLANGIYGYGYCVRQDSKLAAGIYFGGQLIVSLLVVYLTNGIDLSALLFLPIIVHTSVLLQARENFIVNLLVALGYALSLGLSNVPEAIISRLPIMIGGQFFVVNFMQMVLNEEKSRIEIDGLIKDLEATNEQLRLYAAQIEELTLVKERNRMAREIHDGLGHYLTTIGMQIKAARATLKKNPDKAVELLHTAENLSQDALRDVRQSVSALRLTMDMDIPFFHRLTRLLKPFNNIGYDTEVLVTGDEFQLTPEVEILFFRTMQEGLSNIGKHSNASKITINIQYHENGNVSLGLIDNGIGVKTLKDGFGIMGLRERVEQLNGTINIDSKNNEGLSLLVTVPSRK